MFWYLCFNYIKVGHEMLFQLDYEKSRSKLNFEFLINFVGRPLLLQCVVGEKEHVTMFVESP